MITPGVLGTGNPAIVPGENVPDSAIDLAGFGIRSWLPSVFGRTCCNYISFGKANGAGVNATTNGPALNTPDAVAIDAKIDDGKVSSGEVFVLNASSPSMTPLSGCVTAHHSSPSAEPILSNTKERCRVLFWVGDELVR